MGGTFGWNLLWRITQIGAFGGIHFGGWASLSHSDIFQTIRRVVILTDCSQNCQSTKFNIMPKFWALQYKQTHQLSSLAACFTSIHLVML